MSKATTVVVIDTASKAGPREPDIIDAASASSPDGPRPDIVLARWGKVPAQAVFVAS